MPVFIKEKIRVNDKKATIGGINCELWGGVDRLSDGNVILNLTAKLGGNDHLEQLWISHKLFKEIKLSTNGLEFIVCCENIEVTNYSSFFKVGMFLTGSEVEK